MQTRQQLYAQALRQVQSRRQKAVTLATRTMERARKEIPGLDALLRRQALAEAAAGRARLVGGLDEAKAAQDAAAQVRAQLEQALSQAGIRPGDLQPAYTCPLCKDKGEYEGKTCRCVHLEARALRRRELSRISALELSRFDTFELDRYPDRFVPEYNCNPRENMAEILNYCKDYARRFSTRNPSLLMTGTAGLGKTHLALAIAGEVLERGADVIYLTARTFFDQMEREKYAPESDLSRIVQEAELLVLDDLGTEFVTNYTVSALYELVNTRMLRRLPTIYTTNIQKEDVLRARYTEKTASRLLGSCEVLDFYGTDQRRREK